MNLFDKIDKAVKDFVYGLSDEATAVIALSITLIVGIIIGSVLF